MKCSYIIFSDGRRTYLNKKLHTVMMYGDKTFYLYKIIDNCMYVCIDYLCIYTGGLYSDLCFVYYHD